MKWLFVASVTSFLLSCSPARVKEQLNCEMPPTQEQSSKSNNLRVAIYIDGSGSMLGYVKDGETNYVKALHAIRNVFELTGKLPVEYYRNGNNSQRITTSEYYSYAARPIFYDGSNSKYKAVSSPIDAAIVAPRKNEDKMTVIITDLEQNSGDVTKLNKKIQDTYFNAERPDYAVGIWAVKSQFNGNVYIQNSDILKTFNYKSGNTPEKLRPFYILFLGPYRDIKYYFEQLKNYDSQELLANSKLIIFHPDNLIESISNLQTLPTNLPKGINRPYSLVKDGLYASKNNNVPIDLLQIDNTTQNELVIDYNVPFKQYKNSLLIDVNSIQHKKNVQKFDKFLKKFTSNIETSEINEAIKLTNWQILDQENKLKFSAIIQPHKFTSPGVYQFKFDIFTQNLQSPSWWQEWDWTSRTSDKDGSKTHNLEAFLIGLKNRTETMKVEQSDTRINNYWLIGRFCYAIQKN